MKKPGFSIHTANPEPTKPQPIPSSDFSEAAYASRPTPGLRAVARSPWPDGPKEWRDDLDAEIQRLEAKGEEFFLLGRMKRLAQLLAEEIEVLAILAIMEDELEALKGELRHAPQGQWQLIQDGIAMVKRLIDRCKAYLKPPPRS